MSIHEVKTKLNIVEYIGRTVPLKKSGRYYKACCPFHAEKTPSFVVDEERGTWRCYGACADGGDIFSFAMRHHNWSFSDALQALAQEAGVILRETPVQQRQHDAMLEHLRGVLAEASHYYHEQLLASDGAVAYLHGRGLTDAVIRDWQLGYAPARGLMTHMHTLGYTDDDLLKAGLISRSDEGQLYEIFRARVMFPIHDPRGRVVGFGGRSRSTDIMPKYLNSPQSEIFHKERLLYGYHQAQTAIRSSEVGVVVEGYMDALQAHYAGFTNVVAQMGTALTEAQIALLKSANRVVLALDGDEAGIQAMVRAIPNLLKVKTDIRLVLMPNGQDPDDVIRTNAGQWATLIESAMPVDEYLITTYAKPYAQKPIAERVAVAKKMLEIVGKCNDVTYKVAYSNAVADALQLERDSLRQAKPPLGIVEGFKLPTLPTQSNEDAPYERYLIYSLVKDEANFFAMRKLLLTRQVPELDVSDFTRWGSAWALFVEGLKTDNASVYLVDRLDSEDYRYILLDMPSVIAHDMFQYAVLHVKLDSYTRRISELIELQNYDQARALMLDKGKLIDL